MAGLSFPLRTASGGMSFALAFAAGVFTFPLAFSASSTNPTTAILTEASDFLLAESGSFLIQE